MSLVISIEAYGQTRHVRTTTQTHVPIAPDRLGAELKHLLDDMLADAGGVNRLGHFAPEADENPCSHNGLQECIDPGFCKGD